MVAIDPDDVGFLIANARLVDRDHDGPGAIFVRSGKISAVYFGEEADRIREDIERMSCDCGEPFYPGPPEVIDARGAVLMPAFVDLHAHFRDPGLTHKEDLESGSRAAAAGGYGTVVLMANTNPPVSDQNTALSIDERARAIGLVDAFQCVSLTRALAGLETDHLDTLDPRLVPVASEDGREVASASVMLDVMERCAARGVTVSCHCEDPELAARAKSFRETALKDPASAGANLAAAERLLALAENTLTDRNLALAASAGCRIHIAHVSTATALDSVRRAKKIAAEKKGAAGFAVTCEVTPHHLSLASGTPAIVNPPLRSDADRAALIQGILDGTVDAIATDHAPHTAEDKVAGAPGFSGIQTAFTVCNSALVETGHIDLSRLSALMSARPAEILSLPRGLLRSGYDADFVLVDPKRKTRVDASDPARWFSKGRNSPFDGNELTGEILVTFKRGRRVFDLAIQ
jgi:dihydroorotase